MPTATESDGAHDHDDAAGGSLGPLLDRVAELAPERADAAQAFAVAAYRRMPAEFVAELDVNVAAAHIVGALAFLDERGPGEIAIRVWTPTIAADGWGGSGAVVEVSVDDGPFLLSTVTEELGRLGLEASDVMHPILGVERDEQGGIAAVLPARHAARRESYLQLALGQSLSDEVAHTVSQALRTVLSDTLLVTRDFRAMRAAVGEVAFQLRAGAGARYAADEVDEAQALLAWLLDDHFVLLGFREYDLIEPTSGRAAQVRPGTGLGLLADESRSSYAKPVALADIAPGLRARMEGGDLLIVARSNRTSTVHRQVRMIYVGVKKVGGDGVITGEYRLLGLFAQKAFADAASTIPVLRRKLRQILEREDIVDHSYDERALRALFDSFPKHELFRSDTDDLRETLVQLLEIAKRQEVRLLCRVGPNQRSVSALVAVPRGRFNGQIRQRVQDLLMERFAGSGVDYQLSMTERDQALLHFMIHTDQPALPEVSFDALEAEVRELTRSFQDDVRVALVAAHGEVEGGRLAQVWAPRMALGYSEVTAAEMAVADIAELAALEAAAVAADLQPGDAPAAEVVRMRIARNPADVLGLLRFRLYKAGAGVELSSFLPILESLGLIVVEEIPHRFDGAERELHLHDFGLRVEGLELDVDGDGPRLAAAALAVWQGRAEADSLNRLVVRAGMAWQDVAVLRAYRRYRRQVGTAFSQPYENDALVANPAVAQGLVELFSAHFDPEPAADGAAIDAVRSEVLAGIEAVSRLDIDRILRGYLGMIDATLRTNRYVRDAEDRPRAWLALKLDSAAVPDMPKPVPHVEVFVYHPEVEGVHLRGGPVARGGLRWSDRIEDFRTEVLGLMKAQVTKNAVIVPTGSKGGFVLKRPPSHSETLRHEVRRQYEVFIRGLLDVTDNVVDGAVVAPDRVRRRDGDDPYLVVAADRGTATFSDVANGISAEYGYWLDDAFASGGGTGYDHKAMGITARGAWVAVQRHFHELDVDIQHEPIRVVGIGDMSGDVFGNGLLLSEAVRLVAAFDHRDVFLDPDPDAAVSFGERRRLFALPTSSWQDYDRAAISAGGGVWARTAKAIPLSEQVRRLLRTDAESLAPPELIKALLRAPVDLLFAGGIGTFVKAADETHAHAGDRTNDAIRVNGDEVGARVIGEGGNLAVTQRGRIQYARRGGRCNTDAVDNSAGVDTSDREVNLKILLGTAVAAGDLVRDERDELLAVMTDEVAEQVLCDNRLQTWALSQELAYAPGGMEAYEALMVDLEDAGRLDRAVEVLPATAEMLRRREAGAGLTRPELAVLLGYAKIDLKARLGASDLPEQPALIAVAEGYFPAPAVARCGDHIAGHRLHRELVTTVVANDIVNRMGITWVSRTSHELGAMAYETAAAYWIARTVLDAEGHWNALEATGTALAPALQIELKAEVDRVVDVCARTYVRQGCTVDIGAAIERDRPAFEQLEKIAVGGGTAARRSAALARIEHFVDLGVDDSLAERVVGVGELTIVPDVAEVGRVTGHEVRHVAEVFARVGDLLPLDLLHARLRGESPHGHWERWQVRGLVDELGELRRAAATGALVAYPDAPASGAVEAFLAAHAGARQRAATLLHLLEREQDAGLDAVAVAVRALRAVVTH